MFDVTFDGNHEDDHVLAGCGHSIRRTAGTMSIENTVLRDLSCLLTSMVTAGPVPSSGRITTNALHTFSLSLE